MNVLHIYCKCICHLLIVASVICQLAVIRLCSLGCGSGQPERHAGLHTMYN